MLTKFPKFLIVVLLFTSFKSFSQQRNQDIQIQNKITNDKEIIFSRVNKNNFSILKKEITNLNSDKIIVEFDIKRINTLSENIYLDFITNYRPFKEFIITENKNSTHIIKEIETAELKDITITLNSESYAVSNFIVKKIKQKPNTIKTNDYIQVVNNSIYLDDKVNFIQIINTKGQVIYTNKTTNNISTDLFPKGVYIANIKVGNKSYSKKINLF